MRRKDAKLNPDKVQAATKWSTITEVSAKAIQPLTNMILARLLAPEAFGVVASVVLVTSFVDLFSDSGFQKYLIQHDFTGRKELYEYANVAFWVNLGFSLFLWGVIALFADGVAELVGSPGLGVVLVVACAQLPMTSFSSIQTALFRRDFDFKAMFPIRMAVVCTPLAVSVPLAALGLGYWALILGSIAGQLLNAILLTLKSPWKPQFYFSKHQLKTMLSFTVWTLLEAISIWITANLGILVCGRGLNAYYLGLFKTSISMVSSCMSIFTASFITVLFSTLSRTKDDETAFRNTFFSFQRLLALMVLPVGAGVCLYRDLATRILLGAQWMEAAELIGMEGLTLSIRIITTYLCSEVYRAKGRPRLSMFVQLAFVAAYIPVLMISVRQGYVMFARAYCGAKVIFLALHLFVANTNFALTPWQMLKNVYPYLIGATCMSAVALLLQQRGQTVVWQIISIVICALIYCAVVWLIPAGRSEMLAAIKTFGKTEAKAIMVEEDT